MLLVVPVLALRFVLQAGSPPPQRPPQTVVRDSTPGDSVARNAPRRLPVTAEVLASAFRDPAARDLFNRARQARLSQDSSINSYDAKVKQRMSVNVGIGRFSPERLVYRHESAARVQWERDAGVRVEMTGARVGLPVIGSAKEERDAVQGQALDSEMSPIPYFPGSEAILISNLAAQVEVNERSLVNPLAGGAEAYYTYATGDSISFRLPGGQTIQLRELKVRPRVAKPNVTVGSLWFDTKTGQLVRAAYRLAVPAGMNIGVDPEDADSSAAKVIGAIIKAIVSPAWAEISGIVVEYGLFQGRFWLPRSQSIEGRVQAMFARVPLRMESAFSYASINSPLGLPKIVVDTTTRGYVQTSRRPPPGLDSTGRQHWRDSTTAARAALAKARQDSTKAGMRLGTMRQCDTSDMRIVTRYRSEARVPVETRVPCDLDKLMSSPDLPASLYDPGEEFFGSSDAEKTLLKTLSMAAQPPISLFSLSPPRLQLGPSMTRYNRVEGFSTGLLAEQQLGGGYVATGIARFGVADRVPNFELSLARTNLSKTITLNGYRRLVSANDWGNPLSFGGGLSAFFFGRDEGFYYRATGAEALWTSDRGARLEWRAFAERETGATQRTAFSLAGNFQPNIEAASGVFTGGGVRFVHSYGLAARGFRAFTDFRLEGAHGDSSYGRGALDLTLSHGLFGRLDGAITLAGGTSVGHLPPQRRWFLGGTETIRGQSPDSVQSGNAFWLGRVEFARASTGYKTSLFADFGWTGDREQFSEVGRPMSGVGIGWSIFDGLLRFDVARGLYPREQTRVSLYLGARF